MNTHTQEVTTDTFDSEVLQSDTPVLVDFTAEWCPPCKMIDPIVEALASEYAGKMKVRKLDADTNGAILMKYGVMGMPTLILFKGGEPVERINGYQAKNKIVGKLEKHLI